MKVEVKTTKRIYNLRGELLPAHLLNVLPTKAWMYPNTENERSINQRLHHAVYGQRPAQEGDLCQECTSGTCARPHQ